MTITVSIHVFTNHIFISNNKTKLNFASSNNIYIWFPVSVVKRKRRYYLKMPKVNNINQIVFRILKSSFELVKKKDKVYDSRLFFNNMRDMRYVRIISINDNRCLSVLCVTRLLVLIFFFISLELIRMVLFLLYTVKCEHKTSDSLKTVSAIKVYFNATSMHAYSNYL